MSTALPNIGRVGFFHFGEDHDRPIESLRSSLEDAKKRYGRLNDSLVVLPEGFNLGQSYWDKAYGPRTVPSMNPSIIGHLSAVSASYQCALVAGLIIDDVPDVDPPYNSAYLIDGDHCRLLARKHRADHSTNYTPSAEFKADPIIWRGVGIIALICLDSFECTQHFQGLADQTVGCPAVVCVPMHMSNGLGDGRPGYKLARYALSTAVWVAANSRPTDVNSFVAGRDGVIRDHVGTGTQIHIELFRLADVLA